MNFYITIREKESLHIIEFNSNLKNGFHMSSDDNGNVYLMIGNVHINWSQTTKYMMMMIDNKEIYEMTSNEKFVEVWTKLLKLQERKILMDKICSKQLKIKKLNKDFEE